MDKIIAFVLGILLGGAGAYIYLDVTKKGK
jgi:hypothetical protein